MPMALSTFQLPPAEWTTAAKALADRLLGLHRYRQKHEKDRQTKANRDKMDSTDPCDIGEILRASIGLPRAASHGLDWLEDADGFIIQS
jgi:hypothetical protein